MPPATHGAGPSRSIVVAVSSLEAGGAERVASLLASAWAAAGHDVALVTLSGAESDHFALDPRCRRVPLALLAHGRGRLSGYVARIRSLRRILRDVEPDVVVSFGTALNVLILSAALPLRIPVVVSERTVPWLVANGAVVDLLRRWLYPRAASVVVQTEPVADWVRRFVPAERVRVIPNPVAAFEQERRPEPILAGVGRLSREKGFDLLIRAFAQIAARHPDWRLVISGEGDEREALSRLARDLGLGGRVSLPGLALSSDVFRTAGIFALPSRFEGFPNALLEAMAAAVPVVAFACPVAPAELIDDGIDGILVPPEDPAALAAALEWLMTEAGERDRLGTEAKRRAGRFDPARIVTLWTEILTNPGASTSRPMMAGVMGSRFWNAEAALRTGEHVRFSFGANWRKYVERIDATQLRQAEQSLVEAFDGASFDGSRFVDVGSGSGIFSLAAVRLGAKSVHSIDFDPNSVACALELSRREGRPDQWTIERGSILDGDFVGGVAPGDRVYSWGVLHHTGAMWEALENALRLVAPGGLFCVALYTRPSHLPVHMALKRAYNALPPALRPGLAAAYAGAWLARTAAKGENPLRKVAEYGATSRGMSFWRDVEDWLGGLPFEYADEETIRTFVEPRGFDVIRVVHRPPGANDEYLLRRAR